MVADLPTDDLLSTVVANAPLVLFATDETGIITLSRGRALYALGLREGELVGRSVFDLYRAEPAVADAARRALAGESLTAKLLLDGIVHETWFSPIRNASGSISGIVGVATDITERDRAESELRYRLINNPVTGVYTRAHFILETEAAANVTGSGTLMLFQLHQFSDLSVTFGYHNGTEVLRQAGARVQEAASADAVVGGLEAGKFAVFVPGREAAALEEAKRLITTLSVPYAVAGRPLHIPIHAGLATYPAHGDSIEQLIRNCELSMQSLGDGESTYAMYDPGSSADPTRNFMLLSDLRSALDSQGLRLEYQPLISVVEHATDCVEALLRWDHPTLGSVPPSEFIGLAERVGMISEVTRFVLAQGVEQLDRWHAEGVPLRLAMNISPRDLQRGEFEEELWEGLGRSNVTPERLILEVTERAELMESSIPRLRRLRQKGIGLAIDDFGTGYSNIANLRQLPYDQIKIDASFTRAASWDETDRQIVAAMVDLGHRLGKTVVAEGIETPEAWDAMVELGCDFIQGFHIARPMRPEGLMRWVRESGWGIASA